MPVTLKTLSINLNFSVSSGYSAKENYCGKNSTPKDAFLEALERMARLSAYLDFEDEAKTRFTEAMRIAASAKDSDNTNRE